MNLIEVPNAITKNATRWMYVGSRVTCDPPPVGTDQDVLVYVDLYACNPLFNALEAEGWECDGSEMYMNSVREGEGFQSYRKGELNLVITSDSEFYDRFVAATSVAKRFNLLDKADRVALFQAVLYGNPVAA